MPVVNVKCKLLKEIHHFEVNTDAPVSEFRQKLVDNLYLPIDQRLKYKGKIIECEKWEDCHEPLAEGAMIMIMQ